MFSKLVCSGYWKSGATSAASPRRMNVVRGTRSHTSGLEQADQDVDEHCQEYGNGEREHETPRRATVDTYPASPLAASAEHVYFLAAVFFGAARRGFGAVRFPLATSPVGSFESPAFSRSFSAISAISCGA